MTKLQEKEIISTILNYGVKPHLSGFKFLVDATEIMLNDKQRTKSICQIYNEVAAINNTTSSKVERAIRNARALTESKEIKKMCNAEFMARIVLQVSFGIVE